MLAAVTFTPAANFNSNFTIATSVTDGVAPAVTGTKAVIGVAVNDAPTATNLSAAETYTQDTNLNLTDIVVSDVDSSSVTATLTLSTTSAGTLSTATSGSVTSTFSSGVWTASGAIADVNTLLSGVTFVPTSGYNSNFTIATSISDGALSVTGSKAMTGIAVTGNHAPVLDSSKSPTLRVVIEASPAPSGAVGTPIYDIIDFSSNLSNVTDADGEDGLGIAITSANSSNGTWWYTTNGGASWTLLGSVSTSSARLLKATASNRLYFQPTFPFFGTVANAITFRAWDETSGTNGGLASTSSSGGTTAFSSATDTASIIVSPGNTAPVLDATKSPALNAIAEDPGAPSGAVGTLISSIVDFDTPSGQVDNITDSDGGAIAGIAITSVDAILTCYYSLDNGTTWDTVGTVSASSARLITADYQNRIYCQPSVDYNGTVAAAITFRAWDATGTEGEGELGDSTQNGSGFAYSTATDTASLVVTPVNDAPVLDVTKTPALSTISEDAAAPAGATGTLVSSLVDLATPAGQVDNITDVDSAPFLGIAITDVNVNLTCYYSLNSGSSWTPIGSVSNSAALLLAANGTNRIYCRPAPDFNGSNISALTIRAWDQTSGSDGSTVSVSTNGGTTAFSSASDSVVLTITAVNDAPVLDAAKSPALTGYTPDAGAPSGAVGTQVSSLVDFTTPAGGLDNVTDVDSGAVTGIAIIAADGSNITWYYSVNSGATWTPLGAVSSTSARLLSPSARIYAQPDPGFTGSATILFVAWDQTSGTDGGLANATVTGGTTAFSSASDSASISAAIVTDSETEAPTLVSPAPTSIFAIKPQSPLQTVQYSIPEPMASGSLVLTFIPASGSPIVINLTDIPDNEVGNIQEITIDPNGGIQSLSHVVTTSADSIPFGLYTVTISYSDSNYNTAASASVADVAVVGEPQIPTNLGPSDHINNSNVIADLQPTFTFDLSDSNPDASVGYTFFLADGFINNVAHTIIQYQSALGDQGSNSFTVGQAAGTGSYTLGTEGQSLVPGAYFWSVQAFSEDEVDPSEIAYGWNRLDSSAYSFTIGTQTTTTSGSSGGVVAALPTVQSVGGTVTINTTPTVQPASSDDVKSFLKNLRRGMDDQDVARLQYYLNTHGFPVSTTGWGSLGQEATVFGSKTFKALAAFQKSIGLPATGYFGPMTREYINSHK